MHSLYDALLRALGDPHNQFLSGGLTLMLLGGLMAYCRKAPKQIFRWIERRVTVTVDISSDDPLFAWISLWLAEHPYSQRVRILTATSERDGDGRGATPSPASGRDETLPQILLTPAPGNHLLLYRGRLLWLVRDRKETPPSGNNSNDVFVSFFKREVFTIRILGRSQQVARRLLEDARGRAMARRSKRVELFVANYDYWENLGERDPRPLSTVFLPDGIADRVVSDVQAFLDNRQRYIDRGIPWRRGWLFHGLPGTGKTSLICALAGHFKMNLYILNIASASLSDDRLLSLLSRVPLRSMILLEDIDSAFAQRKKSRDSANKLTFSGLLNGLDGAASKEGMMVFMTTNRLAQLDAALVRPGRADVHVEFTHANANQASNMFRAFFPEANGDAEVFGDAVGRKQITMAEIQQHLLVHEKSSVQAVDGMTAN